MVGALFVGMPMDVCSLCVRTAVDSTTVVREPRWSCGAAGYWSRWWSRDGTVCLGLVSVVVVMWTISVFGLSADPTVEVRGPVCSVRAMCRPAWLSVLAGHRRVCGVGAGVLGGFSRVAGGSVRVWPHGPVSGASGRGPGRLGR